MASQLTIVMYHYVRDLARTRFPEIKGRDVAEFRVQLEHIAAHYEVVTAEQVTAAVAGQETLPANACWLTFDDGYFDHYQHVLPLLLERGWQGSFYAPSQTVTDRKILDVNKIHFILAAASDTEPLIDDLKAFYDTHRAAGWDLAPWQQYWATYAHPNRWDTAEVIFLKRMLQRGLPERLRNDAADELFSRYVTADTDAFAAELYLDAHQLRAMHQLGMHLGSHGAAHYWLDALDPAAQAADIDESLAFLRTLGVDTTHWTMCYPYGAYDEHTLEILRDRNCMVATTVNPGVATIPGDPPLALDRLDTNDLPYR